MKHTTHFGTKGFDPTSLGMQQLRGNYESLNVNGIATADAPVHVRGQCRIDGVLEGKSFFAAEMDVGGTVELESLEAESVRIKGTGTVQTMKSGRLSVDGTLTARSINGNTATIEGTLSGSSLNLRGAICSTGTVEIDTIEVDVLEVRGALVSSRVAAREVTLLLDGDSQSRVGEVQTPRLAVRRIQGSSTFTAQHVRGDEIRIEHSSVGSLEGRVVVIGPGCTVESVIYKESLEVASGSIVKKQRKEN